MPCSNFDLAEVPNVSFKENLNCFSEALSFNINFASSRKTLDFAEASIHFGDTTCLQVLIAAMNFTVL